MQIRVSTLYGEHGKLLNVKTYIQYAQRAMCLKSPIFKQIFQKNRIICTNVIWKQRRVVRTRRRRRASLLPTGQSLMNRSRNTKTLARLSVCLSAPDLISPCCVARSQVKQSGNGERGPDNEWSGRKR
jgi:hypothetical protein